MWPEPSFQEQSLFLPTKQSLNVNPIATKLPWEDAQLLPLGLRETPRASPQAGVGGEAGSSPPQHRGAPQGAGGEGTRSLCANASTHLAVSARPPAAPSALGAGRGVPTQGPPGGVPTQGPPGSRPAAGSRRPLRAFAALRLRRRHRGPPRRRKGLRGGGAGAAQVGAGGGVRGSGEGMVCCPTGKSLGVRSGWGKKNPQAYIF